MIDLNFYATSLTLFLLISFRKLLSASEVESLLEHEGVEDVVTIDMTGKMDSISSMVICSGKSRRQMGRAAELLVEHLRKRRLSQAPGFAGFEGAKMDDWLVIDCHNIVVHLMLPTTRAALNLEDHWNSVDRPVVKERGAISKKSKARGGRMGYEYEQDFQRLLDEHPIPQEYQIALDQQDAGADGTHGSLNKIKLKAKKKQHNKRGDVVARSKVRVPKAFR